MIETSFYNWKSIISMTNGIIGVSILAMPYCFAKCGIVLGIVLLTLSGIMTSYSCKLLIKSAIIHRSRSLEYLAFKTLGRNGKLFTEICVILLLIGSLVTYQETLGDTAPAFISKLFNIQHSKVPRTFIMILFTVCIALPLSLSRKLDKLSHLSAFSIGFYFFFSFYLINLASDKIEKTKELTDSIKYWDLSGIWEVIPIFSISFSCQTVLFVVYDELPDVTRDKIMKIIDLSVIIVYLAYLLVGVFGYLAFYDTSVHGNVIKNIPETNFSLVIFLGFLFCVLSGYPFMVFPCRTSINTLFFSSREEIMESDLLLPDYRFNNITYGIVFATTMIALIIPNMEFVLAFTGATTGSIICFILPAILYIYSISGKHNDNTNNGTNISFVHIFLILGSLIFFFCTFASLATYSEDSVVINTKNVITSSNTNSIGLISKNNNIEVTEVLKKKTLETILSDLARDVFNQQANIESRKEPPIPKEVDGNKNDEDYDNSDDKDLFEPNDEVKENQIKPNQEQPKLNENNNDKPSNVVKRNLNEIESNNNNNNNNNDLKQQIAKMELKEDIKVNKSEVISKIDESTKLIISTLLNNDKKVSTS